jgi:hypothetical protein
MALKQGIGCLILAISGALLVSCVVSLVDPRESSKPPDFRRPVFAKEGTYVCSFQEQLRDINMSAIETMQKVGGTFETCTAFGPQEVVVLQHSSNGTLVQISPKGLSAEDTEAVAAWTYATDLRN